jgi:hypothetical protein
MRQRSLPIAVRLLPIKFPHDSSMANCTQPLSGGKPTSGKPAATTAFDPTATSAARICLNLL